jgi:hypothetical protein
VLDVMVARPRFVAGNPRGQRPGRLGPVNDRERNQREADGDGKPDEKTAPLHGRELTDSVRRSPRHVKVMSPDRSMPRPASSTAVQYETATLGSPFRSPSRFRFRPPDPLTFGFRLLPPVPASTYLRSVLGAEGNLGEAKSFRKRSKEEKGAICKNSIIHISTADLAACGNPDSPLV